MTSLAQRWGTDVRPGDRRRAANVQITLDRAKTIGRGGLRPNAGRPSKEGRKDVAHIERAKHRGSIPVHITLRRAANLPDLRLPPLHDEIQNCIRDAQCDAFRIAHYSIQGDHVHLIVEAADDSLERGIRGFVVRVARRLNSRVLRRRGAIWAGRYHRRDLPTPREVRNALVYVLANGAKHGEVDIGEIDPCSSGRWFTGWMTPLAPPTEPSPVRPAETWLLSVGWTKVFPGHIFPTEVPKAARVKT